MTTPPPPADEATSTPPLTNRPVDYDSEFENWLEEPQGASIPTRKGKGKYYQIISSSEHDTSPSSPSDKDDPNYELSDKGGEGASSHQASEDNDNQESSQGASSSKVPRVHPSPPPSPEPYSHPKVEEWEEDVDWTEYEDMELSFKMVEEIKKNKGKLSCVDQPSSLSWEELEWTMAYYEQKGTAVVPLEEMRAHRFDIGNYRIPRLVLTPRHVSLGVGAPIHEYFEVICEWFDVAPIQLSPNSYKLAAGLYILYRDEGYGAPSMEELSYFFRLTRSSLGYFFLVVRKQHNNKGFSEGRASHIKKWKEPFFYVYDVKRVRTQFNISPG